MSIFKYTAEDVRKRREETGQGMMTCKTEIEREQIAPVIERIGLGAATPREIAEVLAWIVAKVP